MSKPRAQRIHVKPDHGLIEISGWLGRDLTTTYLWIGMGDKCLGHVSGRKLVRLCKAIIRRAETQDE